MVDTTENYKALASAVISQAYDDLVNGYETKLAKAYKSHGRNTMVRCKSKTTVYSANKMIHDCEGFFRSDDFLFYAQDKNICGERFIKQAKKDAVRWFRDKDQLLLAQKKREQEKIIKAYLRKRKERMKRK